MNELVKRIVRYQGRSEASPWRRVVDDAERALRHRHN
jgi:hypothetical protein